MGMGEEDGEEGGASGGGERQRRLRKGEQVWAKEYISTAAGKRSGRRGRRSEISPGVPTRAPTGHWPDCICENTRVSFPVSRQMHISNRGARFPDPSGAPRQLSNLPEIEIAPLRSGRHGAA